MSDVTQINGLPPRRVKDVAAELGLDTDGILPHGHYIAKIPITELAARQADALRRLGKKAIFCVREP